MERLEKGNYKLPNWSMEARCTGNGWGQKKKTCYGKWKLEDGDILKRVTSETTYYGFICPDCHCFTELDSEKIPLEVREYCPQVAARGSDHYEKLTDEEKKLSEVL